MFTYTIFFRATAIILIFGTYFYWLILARKADMQKPRHKKPFSLPYVINRHSIKVTTGIVILQLCGISLFPMPVNIYMQTFGFLIVLAGVIMSILARRELGTNWTHAADYQVKNGHVLITSGVYAYVRHPIYFASNITLIGGELIVGSWLFVFFYLNFLYDYHLAKNEETILIEHFGKEYTEYMKKTKMLIPFIF